MLLEMIATLFQPVDFDFFFGRLEFGVAGDQFGLFLLGQRGASNPADSTTPDYDGAPGYLGVTVSQPRAPFSSCYPAVITPPGLPGP